LPIRADTHPLFNVPHAFQSAAPFSSAKATTSSDCARAAALARVVELAGPRRQVLKVETYNGEPALQSPVASRLAELGFVRDYPGMTYYGAWAKQVPQSSATAVPQGG